MPIRDEKVNAPAPVSRSTKTGSARFKPKVQAVTKEATVEIIRDQHAAASNFTATEMLVGLQDMSESVVVSRAAEVGPEARVLGTVAYRAARRLVEQRADQNRPDPEELEVQALMNSVDKDLMEIHQRIDRVLAQWDNG